MLNASRTTQRLLEHADFLENLDPKKYDQRDFDRCICGWHNWRMGRRTSSDVKAAAADFGITQEQASRLFHAEAGRRPEFNWYGYGEVVLPTPKDAARCLRHIAVTGDLPDNW